MLILLTLKINLYSENTWLYVHIELQLHEGSIPEVFAGVTASRTSLKSSSRLCCFLRSIFFTATCLPLCFSLAMHTIPVEPSPILIKLSRYSRGSPVGKNMTLSSDATHKTYDLKKLVCSLFLFFLFSNFLPGLTTS